MNKILIIFGIIFILAGVGLLFSAPYTKTFENADSCKNIKHQVDSILTVNDSLKMKFKLYNSKIDRVLNKQDELLKQLDTVINRYNK